MTATPVTRARALDIARAWLGTPYHHQASTLGAGTDCIGLVRGVFRTLYGREPEALPGYSRDWAEASGDETLIAAARRHLVEIDPLTAAPADILVFRFRPNMVAKHTGILGCTPFSLSPLSALERGEGWSERRPRPLDPGERWPPLVPCAPTFKTNTCHSRARHLGAFPRTHGSATSSDAIDTSDRSANGLSPTPNRETCPPNPLFFTGSANASASLTLIHALEGAAVAEVPFADWWRRRIAAAFSFPGITD